MKLNKISSIFVKNKQMKNIVIIDVDTERDTQVKIGKSDDSQKPTNPEEAKAIILNDLTCVVEGLSLIIRVANNSGYAKKEDIIAGIVKHLNEILVPTPIENNESTQTVNNGTDINNG